MWRRGHRFDVDNRDDPVGCCISVLEPIFLTTPLRWNAEVIVDGCATDAAAAAAADEVPDGIVDDDDDAGPGEYEWMDGDAENGNDDIGAFGLLLRRSSMRCEGNVDKPGDEDRELSCNAAKCVSNSDVADRTDGGAVDVS